MRDKIELTESAGRPEGYLRRISRSLCSLGITISGVRTPVDSTAVRKPDPARMVTTFFSAKAPTSLTRRAPLAEASGATAPWTLARQPYFHAA